MRGGDNTLKSQHTRQNRRELMSIIKRIIIVVILFAFVGVGWVGVFALL